uniref:Pex2_Pex12 domain-containing protein n=1 Tax=Heterorhabditis bacteriophora TaxID=37862 RepID=A0A1I7WX95_HETBA
MQAYVAEIGEIVRAQRRDEEELDEIRERISRVSFYLMVRNDLYFRRSSLFLLEYMIALQNEFITVKIYLNAAIKANVNLPSFLFQRAQKKLSHPSTLSFLGICLKNNNKARKTFQSIIDWIRSVAIPQLYRLHLAVFYIFGAYYNISRRAVGIRFLSLNAQTDIKALKVYRVFRIRGSVVLFVSSVVVHLLLPVVIYFVGRVFRCLKDMVSYRFTCTVIFIQSLPPATKMILSVVNQHAISVGPKPAEQMRYDTRRMLVGLLACGVDPSRTLLFRQSDVSQVAQLSWILGSLQTVTKLQRMPQYKEKAARFTKGEVPVGLLTYPLLQAADVLLYKVTRSVSARIRSLRQPLKKMSKSEPSDRSRINIIDSREEIRTKCRKAVSDSDGLVKYEPENRPAVSNLLAAIFISSTVAISQRLVWNSNFYFHVDDMIFENGKVARQLAEKNMEDVLRIVGFS